ncbi:MAG: PAS domain-containing protein, partial [Syntrophobacteraceae bacterium]
MEEATKTIKEMAEELERLRGELAALRCAGPDDATAKELERQSKLRDAFLKYTLNPMTILDSGFNYIHVSESYAKAAGRRVEEYVGRNHFEMYPSEAKGIFEHAVRTKQPYRVYARPFVNPDHPEWGETYWDWNLVPLLDEGGEVEILVLSLNDVTESMRAKQKLQAELNFKQTLIDTVPVPIFYKDPGGRYLSCNRAFEQFYGLDRFEIVGKTAFDILPEHLAQPHYEHDRKLLESPGVQVYETRTRDGAGHMHDMIFHKATFLNADGRIGGIVGALMDITGQRRAEETLAAHVAQVESLNEELKEFASVASHDLLEPLRKIQGFGALLRNRCRDLFDDEGKDYLDRMTGAAHRMETLLGALLDYSRLGTQGQPFTRIDLRDVVRDVVSDLEWSLKKCGGRVEIGDLPAVEADDVQMRQLFQNLIANSLKYRKSDERPVIRVYGSKAGETAEVSVEDNGIGFSEEYADRIFKPFHRLHGRSAYEGTGMGLAICRKI